MRKRTRTSKAQKGGSSGPIPGPAPAAPPPPPPSQDKKTVDLVIARYKEPLDWLDKHKDRPFRKINIYNKSDTEIKCPTWRSDCTIKQLPNVGVCDHTYLYHIVENYDSLADVTVFIPGSSQLHHKRPRVDATIDKAFSTGQSVVYGYLRPRGVKDTLFTFKIDRHVTADKNNQDELNYYQYPAAVRPFGRWYEKHFPNERSNYESNGGIFAASKADLHQRSKEFYIELLEEVSKHKYHEASHFIERSWATILKLKPLNFYSFALLGMRGGGKSRRKNRRNRREKLSRGGTRRQATTRRENA